MFHTVLISRVVQNKIIHIQYDSTMYQMKETFSVVLIMVNSTLRAVCKVATIAKVHQCYHEAIVHNCDHYQWLYFYIYIL